MTTTEALLIPADENKPVTRVTVDTEDYRTWANAIHADLVQPIWDTHLDRRGVVMFVDEEYRVRTGVPAPANRRANLLTSYDMGLGGDVLIVGIREGTDEDEAPEYGDIAEFTKDELEAQATHGSHVWEIPLGSIIRRGAVLDYNGQTSFEWEPETLVYAACRIPLTDGHEHIDGLVCVIPEGRDYDDPEDFQTELAAAHLCNDIVVQVLRPGVGPTAVEVIAAALQGLGFDTVNQLAEVVSSLTSIPRALSDALAEQVEEAALKGETDQGLADLEAFLAGDPVVGDPAPTHRPENQEDGDGEE